MGASAHVLEALNVLVVDDQPDVLDVAATILSAAGARVSAASSPFGAEDMIRSRQTDLLLTDILMPGRDGLELLRSARAAGFAGPAVAMSAGGPGVLLRARQAGFDRWVQKPLDPQVLVASVAQAAAPFGARVAPASSGRRQEMLRGIRVLLVEDHQDTLDIYAAGLRELGAEVSTAASAQMGLMALERHTPDVLVIDIGLPDVDGNELLRKVRAARPAAGWDRPAIALTAFNSLQDRMRTVDAGFRLHVPKPVEPDYLGRLIAELARRG